MKVSKEINKQGLSIVIGARNEYPQIAMTITNLMEECYNIGLDRFEFILMDNGSTDETSRFFEWMPITKGERWTYKYSSRGMVSEGRLRIFYDPVFSNVGIRNKGVLKARYENVLFSDAHQLVRTGSLKYALETLNEFGGIVHAPVAWMGADYTNPQPGYQYSYKVGEKIWGTWNKVAISMDKPFYIPICGHCFLMVKKQEFLDFRGYPYAQRVYGGGEPYLDTKWYMMGSHSMMEPRALVYHLSAGRGYSSDNNHNIHNMFLVSYILGGQKWLDRILITYLNKKGVYKPFIESLYRQAIEGGREDYEWLQANKKMEFEQVLGLDHEDEFEGGVSDADWYCDTCTSKGRPAPHIMRPWDRLNDKLHGTHRSWVQHFKLHEKDGIIYIGSNPITDTDAIALAKKYL